MAVKRASQILWHFRTVKKWEVTEPYASKYAYTFIETVLSCTTGQGYILPLPAEGYARIQSCSPSAPYTYIVPSDT